MTSAAAYSRRGATRDPPRSARTAAGVRSTRSTMSAVFADAQARQAKILAAAAWPPAELVDALGVDAAYGLLEGAARAKAAQTVQSDPERARAQARWKRDNDYSNALSAWMAAHR
jgi:hypothetical protein